MEKDPKDTDATQQAPVVEAPDYRDPNGEYFPISVEGLKVGVLSDIDIFARVGQGYFLFKPRNVSVQGGLLIRARNLNQPYLYIHRDDREVYFAKLQTNLAGIIGNNGITIREKAGVLTDFAVEIIDQLFQDPGHPQGIASAKGLTQECVRFVSQHRHAFLHLVELSSHDYYTYAHSVGVAAYTLALAPTVMQLTPDQLASVGLAGFLHDIGKCMVDPAIINKKGPLNEDEWAIMKKHPEYGVEILKRHRGLDPLVTLCADGHHENLMGTGYPRGLAAARIEPLVRIISLTDAFSALTTKRSYSTPRDNVTALKLIRENLDKKFDTIFFKPFVKLFLDPSKQDEAA